VPTHGMTEIRKGASLDWSSRVSVRLPMPGAPWRPLVPDEVRSLGLESPPSWVAEFFGPLPPSGSLWGALREHRKRAAAWATITRAFHDTTTAVHYRRSNISSCEVRG
jgi:hypothetical protein